jgi:hypothetical protein
LTDGIDLLEKTAIELMKIMPTMPNVCLGKLGCSGGEAYKNYLENEYYPKHSICSGSQCQTFLDTSADLLNKADFALDTVELLTGAELIPGSWMANAASQMIDDRNSDLYLDEQIMRASIVGLEGVLVDQISISVGTKVGIKTMGATIEASPLIAAPAGLAAGFVTFAGIQYVGDTGSEYINQHVAFPFVHSLVERYHSWWNNEE